VFCLLVVLVRLPVPVQVIDWKRLVSEMTYNVLMGTLNPTHSPLWGSFLFVHTLFVAELLILTW